MHPLCLFLKEQGHKGIYLAPNFFGGWAKILASETNLNTKQPFAVVDLVSNIWDLESVLLLTLLTLLTNLLGGGAVCSFERTQ